MYITVSADISTSEFLPTSYRSGSTLIRAAARCDPPCILKKTSVPIRRIIGEYKRLIPVVFMWFSLQQCVAQYLLRSIVSVCMCRGRVDLDWIPRCVKEQRCWLKRFVTGGTLKQKKKKKKKQQRCLSAHFDPFLDVFHSHSLGGTHAASHPVVVPHSHPWDPSNAKH